jgi:Glycosyl hydrolases family 25
MALEPRTPFRAGGPVTGRTLTPIGGSFTYLADVSEFQPDIADAAYLAWSKAVVIRAMYGDAHDDLAWYGGARRADFHTGGALFVGIYQYVVAGQDAAMQGRALAELVGPLQKGEVLICDLEEGSGNQSGRLTAWYNAVTAYYSGTYGQNISGHLWTYSGLSFSQTSGIAPVDWLADYTSTEPALKHTLWQFSETYNVPGVGTSDCSLFHGTVTQLAALAYGGAVPKPWNAKNWAYVAPRKLTARGGRTTVALDWESPRETVPAWAGTGAVPYPESYTAQIWNGSKLLETRTTTATALQVGSLPKGTFKARVWGNGGPVAPAGAEVAFSTSG